jgi:transposase InsO family protein
MVTYLKKHLETNLTWLLEAVKLSKNAWYYVKQPKSAQEQVIQQIHDVLGDFAYYGYTRVTKELKDRGHNYNHKRIYRIMGENFLLQVRKKSFVPKTTNSNHNLMVYTNEIKHLSPVISPYTVWVSDITYVWVGDKFAYLALVMDQSSRKIVGWHMDTALHRSLCIKALEMATAHNIIPKYHHSDRGVQYCSRDYIKILKNHNIIPSMADVGVSVDNPYAESLNRSIKVEEVYMNAYESFEEAKDSIQKYIEVYNTKRLHSSLGYISPVQFEANYKLTVSKNL